MRTLIVIVAFCFFLFQSKSYAQISIGTTYQMKGIAGLQECDILGNTAGFSTTLIPFSEGLKFTVIGKGTGANAGNYIIQAWLIGKNKTYASNLIKSKAVPKDQRFLAENDSVRADFAPNQLMLADRAANSATASREDRIKVYNYYTRSGQAVRRYFLISEDQITTFAKALKPNFDGVGGTATLPFKWRLQRGAAFDQNLSISGLAGLKINNLFKNPDLTASILLGIGITSIALDSSNSSQTSSANLAAVTLSAGVVFQYKTIQAGVFLGVDKISNNKEYGWKYQGNPWIGIGIGFSIFSESSSTQKESTQN